MQKYQCCVYFENCTCDSQEALSWGGRGVYLILKLSHSAYRCAFSPSGVVMTQYCLFSTEVKSIKKIFSLQCLTFYRHFFWDLLLVTQHFKGRQVWGSRLPGRVCFLLCSLCHEPFVLLFAALDFRHTVSEWLYNPYSHWHFWSCLRLWTDGGNTGYK